MWYVKNQDLPVCIKSSNAPTVLQTAMASFLRLLSVQWNDLLFQLDYFLWPVRNQSPTFIWSLSVKSFCEVQWRLQFLSFTTRSCGKCHSGIIRLRVEVTRSVFTACTWFHTSLLLLPGWLQAKGCTETSFRVQTPPHLPSAPTVWAFSTDDQWGSSQHSETVGHWLTSEEAGSHSPDKDPVYLNLFNQHALEKKLHVHSLIMWWLQLNELKSVFRTETWSL